MLTSFAIYELRPPAAVITLKAGADVTPEDVIGYCKERLAAYKYPREIRFMAELPKGPSGKILKAALRDG